MNVAFTSASLAGNDPPLIGEHARIATDGGDGHAGVKSALV